MADIGKIKPQEITDEMKQSYLAYAMSVIVARALPDVRDGLKPVHRRILYAMNEMGLKHNARLVKSARVVGEVLGKYHPHGDMAVYDSIVRMAQDFSLRYPLIQGQGNWGSVDGDGAAAMRYCVTGDTRIVTEHGLMKIDQISPEKNETIRIKVLSRDRDVHSATKWFDSGEHQTIQITTAKGFSLQGSSNHPILTLHKNIFTGEPHYAWKLLSNIVPGDIAVIDRTPDRLWPRSYIPLTSYVPKTVLPRMQIKALPEVLTEDLASLLGALVAEGTIKEKEIEFCNSNKQWIGEFEKQWQKTFPDCRLHRFARKPSSYGKKPYYTLEIHSQYVVAFLRNLGLSPVTSSRKTIPDCVLQSPKSVVAAFLRAYFEGDGSISFSSTMTELSGISKSEELLRQIQIVLLRFGIAATKRFDAYRDIHKLYIRGLNNCAIFEREIGFLSETKKEKLRCAINRLHNDTSKTDFVPFFQEFVRAMPPRTYEAGRFIVRHNFNRYATMEKNRQLVVSAADQAAATEVDKLFNHFLATHYLFDPIIRVEDAGIQNVYSLRVDSACHSFVGNGFINHNTEMKMTAIAEELLRDIEKETVSFVDNYDATRMEPTVLPSAIPNLLLNGSVGIAVGMATNIPPHNLSELISAIVHLIDHPKADIDELFEFVKGPDFPTGGLIFNEKEIRQAYVTGKGAMLTRANAEIIEVKQGKQILITEIPYQVNKSELIEKMADLVKEKKVEGIKDIRDESGKEGIRIAIDLKDSAFPQKVLNNLYKLTDLEKYFHMHILALVDGGIQPQTLSLKSALEEYIKHREVVVTKRTQFDLARTKERIHILEGLKKALDHIDAVIQTIKKSRDRDEAHVNLVKKFKFSDAQTTAILEMRLQTLAGLERQKIDNELKEKLALARELESILKDQKRISGVIKKELLDIQQKYGDERRTKVVKHAAREIAEEDLIPEEEAIVVVTRGGYIKRLKPETYRVQRRGGKGIIGMETKEEDMVEHFLTANTHSDLLFFTNSGKVFQIKAYEVPEGSRISKGKAIHNFLSIGTDEFITSVLAASKKSSKKEKESRADGASYAYLMMATKHGIMKKVEATSFESVRRSGLIAITLKKGDLLKWVRPTFGKDEVVVVTRAGQAIRFGEKDVRPMGRNAAGVRSIKLKKKDDEVVGMDIIFTADAEFVKKSSMLVMMENGYGKRTPLKEYKKQHRGGSGIKTAKVTSKNGAVIMTKILTGEETEIIAISRKGQVIRTEISAIPTLGRATQGVRIMKLSEGDKLASITTL